MPGVCDQLPDRAYRHRGMHHQVIGAIDTRETGAKSLIGPADILLDQRHDGARSVVAEHQGVAVGCRARPGLCDGACAPALLSTITGRPSAFERLPQCAP